MGASASLMNVEGSPELSATIQAEYERLKSEGVNDVAIEAQLKEKFSESISKSSSKPAQPQQGPVKVRKTIVVPKGLPSKGSGAAGGRGGRRRSFAQDDKPPNFAKPDSIEAAVAATLTHSASFPSIESMDIAKDTWDSVSQQPSCPVCQQTFVKQSLLDRHVKYSEVHMKNVQKMKDRENKISEEGISLDEVEKNLTQQIEGEHYRLLYSGSKMFWRTKDNIDLHIYLHVVPDCIEVVPFDIERHKELARIYLEHYILRNVIEGDARKQVEARKDELKEHKKHDKNYSGVLPSDEVMMEEAKRVVLVSHIIDRLQQISASNGSNVLTYVPPSLASVPSTTNEQTGLNAVQKPALLPCPPSILVPVHITRRRRSNAEDVMSLMTAVAQGREELTRATSRAEKITNLLFMSTNSLLSTAKKWQAMREANHNRARVRWILAINRVLVQNSLKRYMVMIEAYEAKLKSNAASQTLSVGASSPSKVLGPNTETDNRMRRLSGMKKAHEV